MRNIVHLVPLPTICRSIARSLLALFLPAAVSCMPLSTPQLAAPATDNASPAPSAPLATGAELAWAIPMGGVINWSPQILDVSGEQILVASSEEGSVVALDPLTGEPRWRFRPETRLWSDSVTVLDGAVYLAAEGADAYLLNGRDGTLLWRTNLQPAASPPLPGLEARSRAVSDGESMYIPTAGIGSYATVNNPDLEAPLVALDLDDGSERWRTVTANYMLRLPTVDSSSATVYVGGNERVDREIEEGGANRIYALASEDGSQLWRYASDDGLVKSMWAGEGAVVFAGYRDFLVGLDATTGEETWRQHTGNWVQSFAVWPSALTGLGETALAYGSANAFLNVVSALTGETLWRYNIEGTFNYPIGNAIIYNGTVYFISQRGQIHALDPRTGALRWIVDTGLEVRDGLAASADHLFVGATDGTLHAYRLLHE